MCPVSNLQEVTSCPVTGLEQQEGGVLLYSSRWEDGVLVVSVLLAVHRWEDGVLLAADGKCPASSRW